MIGRRTQRQSRFRSITLKFIFGFVVIFGALAIQSAPVAASTFGRPLQQGYFTGTNFAASGTAIFSTGQPSGIGSVAGLDASNLGQFLGIINARLFSGSSSAAAIQDRIGAAFIVDTMLNVPGTAFANSPGNGFNGTNDGIVYAQSNFNTWQSKVAQYDANGLVNWNVWTAYSPNFQNSLYHFPAAGAPGGDDLFYTNAAGDAEWTIAFYDQATGFPVYQIKKNCGNVVGDAQGLPDLTGVISGYKVDPTGQPPVPITSSYGGAKVEVIDGGPYVRDDFGNPFVFGGVPVGLKRVTADTVAGYNITYTYCQGVGNLGDPGCAVGANRVPGNTFVINMQPNQHVDVRFYYTPIQQPYTYIPTTSGTFGQGPANATPIDPTTNPNVVASGQVYNSSGNTGPVATLKQYAQVYASATAGAPPVGGPQLLVGGSHAVPAVGANAYSPFYTGTFTIPAALPAGQVVCFYSSVNPASLANDTRYSVYGSSPPRSDAAPASADEGCIVVQRSSATTLQALQGDVHAGGGVGDNTCTTTGAGGISANTGSYTQFVASANTGISGFGSANVPGGAAETFGNTGALRGNYGTICRPDLAKAVAAYSAIAGNGFLISSATSSISLDDPLFANDGVYNHVGPLTLTGGTVKHKITINNTGGPVTISGNITINGSPDLFNLPTLGIIAGGYNAATGKDTLGTINITKSATMVEGFLVAQPDSNGNGGVIDTCSDHVAGTSDCPALKVIGSLMAHSFAFRRTGPSGYSGATVVTESVQLSGLLYLSPPPGFAIDAAGTGAVQYEGERPPLD